MAKEHNHFAGIESEAPDDFTPDPPAQFRYMITYNGQRIEKWCGWYDNPISDLLTNIKAVSKALLDNYDLGKLIE